MPVYTQGYTGVPLAEFQNRWQQWHNEVMRRHEIGVFASSAELNKLVDILRGDDEVFSRLGYQCETWYCMLISRLFYQQPYIQPFDLQRHAAACIQACAGDTVAPPWDDVIMAALQFDIHKVIKESSERTSNWWFVAHLTDLLHQCDILQSHKLEFGSDLREFLLLEYASSLMSHETLWRLGINYLDHCPQLGRYYQELFLERLPFNNETTAKQLINVCEQFQLTDISHGIARSMAVSETKCNHLDEALSWALLCQDIPLISYISEKYLDNYKLTGGFKNVKFIDSLGSRMLVNTKLTFLCKYREYHQLYEQGKLKQAGNLLLSFLNPGVAPKRFWATLLMDALPLLQAPELILSSQQTFELMNCVEELRIEQALDVDSKKQKKELVKDLDTEQLNQLRLALTSNLARAFVAERSTTL